MDGETVKTFHLLPFKSKMIQGSSIIWTVLFKNKGGIGPPIRYKSLSRKLEMDTFGGAHHYNQEICSSFRWTPKFSIQKSAVKVHAKGLVFLAGEICPGANNGKRNGQRGGRCIKADSFFQVHFPEDLRWIFPMHSKDPHFWHPLFVWNQLLELSKDLGMTQCNFSWFSWVGSLQRFEVRTSTSTARREAWFVSVDQPRVIFPPKFSPVNEVKWDGKDWAGSF